MELIIKPTAACNFDCKFCSAVGMDICHDPNNIPEPLKDLIVKMKPSNLIITGGEPLMMNPEYYYKLHDLSGVRISITSNLKDFMLHPEKWYELFREEWFSVATSFQYGDGRMWDKNTVYTEEMFLRVVDQFCKYVNSTPPTFISVIDENNVDRAIDHVLLAKSIGSVVRLNNALKVGRQQTYFPRYKMYQIYLDIIDKGLEMYETNCRLRRFSTCPKNTDFECNTMIRCCLVDSSGSLHVGICDELLTMGQELTTEDDILGKCPFHLDVKDYIKPECAYCELFSICNGCHINRESSKEVPEHCEEMKKLENRIIESGWKLL